MPRKTALRDGFGSDAGLAVGMVPLGGGKGSLPTGFLAWERLVTELETWREEKCTWSYSVLNLRTGDNSFALLHFWSLSPHIIQKKSLIAMGIVMELHNRACYWPAIREAEGGDEAKEAAEEEDVGLQCIQGYE
uniref:Uncharacterized protein n=1 Tax=Tanacetum cinerariifolium TaxID=118510 RepID=A0A6L2KEW2_TANCI|nr:hypothetical protein [Tanacetum cinerariifolium]